MINLREYLLFFNTVYIMVYCHKTAVCGGELTMEQGKLESPNYPDDYQPNKECVWLLTVPEGFQVALRFDSFEVLIRWFGYFL